MLPLDWPDCQVANATAAHIYCAELCIIFCRFCDINIFAISYFLRRNLFNFIAYIFVSNVCRAYFELRVMDVHNAYKYFGKRFNTWNV